MNPPPSDLSLGAVAASSQAEPLSEAYDGEPVLEARGIEKNFRLGKRTIPVLRGVDFAIREGEMVALLGASGAGKSTLLHVLGLLDRPTSGEVIFRGEAVQSWSGPRRAKIRRREIGFIFQFYHLIPELDALQNILLGRMMDVSPLAWLSQRKAARADAEELLNRVGLSDRRGHRPAELSGGERQRVAIARALMVSPQVILADEPTGNLDSATAEGVLELLFEIRKERKIAFLLVTHNEALAARCNRTVTMRDGTILDGTVRGESGAGTGATEGTGSGSHS